MRGGAAHGYFRRGGGDVQGQASERELRAAHESFSAALAREIGVREASSCGIMRSDFTEPPEMMGSAHEFYGGRLALPASEAEAGRLRERVRIAALEAFEKLGLDAPSDLGEGLCKSLWPGTDGAAERCAQAARCAAQREELSETLPLKERLRSRASGAGEPGAAGSGLKKAP